MEKLYLVLAFLLVPSLCLGQSKEHTDHSGEHYHGQDGKYHPDNDGRGWDIRLSVPGEPEIDYPTYNVIPRTSFNCVGRPNGYYADPESRCQVFRVCTTTGPSGFYSFLCPNGTLFNQIVNVCDWWMNVRCGANDSEILATGRVQVTPGSGMLQDVRKMIMYPMSNPPPQGYKTKPTTTQVYNPPAEMISMFASPPQDIEGQQILGQINSPNLPHNSNKFTTSSKQDSVSSGTTSFNNNPIVVNEFHGTVANTPTVQEDLNSKFIQKQTEILNLQKQFNTNSQQQSIKITKQQFTYPSQFDKQYTVTVPKLPIVNQPYVVNIPINIPALDANEKLVSEQLVAEETNNRNMFRNNTSYNHESLTTVASIPFIILLLKPSERTVHSEALLTTIPIDNNNIRNQNENLQYENDIITKTINYFYPPGQRMQSGSFAANPSNHYIPNPNTNKVNKFNDAQSRKTGFNEKTTINEYKEMTIDLDNAKDFQMAETDKDLLMEQLNKHLTKQEEQLTNDISTNSINTTNTPGFNNLVTIFSANVKSNGIESEENVLKLCIPKEALIYLLKVHNATKQALERHSPNYKFGYFDKTNKNQHNNKDMINMLMQNVLMRDLDYSDRQVPIVNDAELYRNQQFAQLQNQANYYKTTDVKGKDSISSVVKNQNSNFQTVPFVTGNFQASEGGLQGGVKYQTTSIFNQGNFVNQKIDQQNGVAVNRYSAKFNKDQLGNQAIGGTKDKVLVNFDGTTTIFQPQDDNYDQYRITSSVNSPGNIVDEENRGEFFSLQHFGVRQQTLRPSQNVGTQQNSQTNINNQAQVSNFQKTESVSSQNQGARVQYNQQQVSSSKVQKPMPFSRTSNSPPAKNNNNRILNHNMAGFINNQPNLDIRSRLEGNGKQTNGQSDQNTNKNIANNNHQGAFYTYTQEYTKTTGPTITEFQQQHHRTQFVQSNPAIQQQSQFIAHTNGNQKTNVPIILKMAITQKEDVAQNKQSQTIIGQQNYQTNNKNNNQVITNSGNFGVTQSQVKHQQSNVIPQNNQFVKQIQFTQTKGSQGTLPSTVTNKEQFYQTSNNYQVTKNSGSKGTQTVNQQRPTVVAQQQINSIPQNNENVGQTNIVQYTQTKGSQSVLPSVNSKQFYQVSNIYQGVTGSNGGLSVAQIGQKQNNRLFGQTNTVQYTQAKGTQAPSPPVNTQQFYQTYNNQGVLSSGSKGSLTQTVTQTVVNKRPTAVGEQRIEVFPQNNGLVGQTETVQYTQTKGSQTSLPTSQNSQQFYQVSNNNQGITNSARKGGFTQTITKAVLNQQQKPAIIVNQQGRQQQSSGTSQNGFVEQTNRAQSAVSQNGQSIDRNKYDQVISIQRQLGGSNVPAPFMKTPVFNGDQQSMISQQGERRLNGVQFMPQNIIGTVQNGFVRQNQISLPNAEGQFAITTQEIAGNDQVNGLGGGFVTAANGVNNIDQLNEVIGTQDRFNQIEGGGVTQFVAGMQEGNVGIPQFGGGFNNCQFGFGGCGMTTIEEGQGIGGFGSIGASNGQSASSFQNNAQAAEMVSIDSVQQNEQGIGGGFADGIVPNAGIGGFQINTNIGPQVSTVNTDQQTSFVGMGGVQATENQNGVTRVQVIPAYGFSLDSEQERNDYFMSLANGMKNVNKAYIPPYDDSTTNYMLTEINRQAQSGQFTPATFEAMFNGFGAGAGVQTTLNNNNYAGGTSVQATLNNNNFAGGTGVQTMLNDNNYGTGIQFGVRLGGTNNVQGISSTQGVAMLDERAMTEQGLTVENLGYPKEKPAIPFTF